MKFLDRDEEDLIHQQSIKSLSEIGVLVRSEKVLDLLERSGATVDRKSGVALIPENMVNEALKKAPKTIRLCARDPHNDLEIPVEGVPFIATDGLTVYIRDFETGKDRDATKRDFSDLARLADALDAISLFWPIVTISDVPVATHSIHEIWESFKGCTMHVQGDCISAQDAKKQIELAALLTGGEDELKKRPIFSVVSCPIAPLSFERGAVEGQVEMAKAGIPVISMSMSQSGTSSPITIAGTIVNANTENLASLVITQFASPGAPHIYSSSSTPTDMSTGGIDYYSTENLLIGAAMGQMAKRYGRPCMVGSWGVGAKEPGMWASFSEYSGYLATTLCNSDLIPGMGSFDCAKGCSFEQMVIDAYLWENFRPFGNISEISERTVALDVIEQVGHEKSFLTHPHTLKNFRKMLSSRNKDTVKWESTISDSMMPEARKIAKRLLEEHEVPPIDSGIAKQGDELLREYERGLS